MFLRFGTINIWPSRAEVDRLMSEDFKAKYPNTRVIIDCTEIRCQIPSSLLLNSDLFSNYKNNTTLKGLVGISPAGAVTFISQLYTGSISDKSIVEKYWFLHTDNQTAFIYRHRCVSAVHIPRVLMKSNRFIFSTMCCCS